MRSLSSPIRIFFGELVLQHFENVLNLRKKYKNNSRYGKEDSPKQGSRYTQQSCNYTTYQCCYRRNCCYNNRHLLNITYPSVLTLHPNYNIHFQTTTRFQNHPPLENLRETAYHFERSVALPHLTDKLLCLTKPHLVKTQYKS